MSEEVERVSILNSEGIATAAIAGFELAFEIDGPDDVWWGDGDLRLAGMDAAGLSLS